MFGGLRLLAARASRMKRRTTSGDVTSSGLIKLDGDRLAEHEVRGPVGSPHSALRDARLETILAIERLPGK
jgi:hypothetical protein